MLLHIIDEQDRQAFRRFLLFNKWTLYSPCMIIGDSWSWIELGCPFAHTTYSETENKLHLNLIKIWSPSFLAKIFCQKSRSSQKIADFRHTHLLTLDSLYEAHVLNFKTKMKLHQPILLLTDLVRDNIITRIEFKNTIMHYRSYITKTHGQRIKCCTSKVKNTLILLKNCCHQPTITKYVHV